VALWGGQHEANVVSVDVHFIVGKKFRSHCSHLIHRCRRCFQTCVECALRGYKRLATYSAARGTQLAFVQANPRFQERLQREVSLGRLVSAKEDSGFVAYLCSDLADCFMGQVFPVSGRWAIR
jgi:hypothetical protein